MLVLSRRENESIVIGDITVTVISIRGDKVRLGIEAPAHVPVHRREVFDAIRRSEVFRYEEAPRPDPPQPPAPPADETPFLP